MQSSYMAKIGLVKHRSMTVESDNQSPWALAL